jgi:hypothetical protein
VASRQAAVSRRKRLASLPLAWFGYQYQVGEQADRSIRQLGGTVSPWWHWDWRWVQAKVARLRAAPVSDADLERIATLSTLGALDLSSTSITDDGLRHLTAMKNLTCLDISDTTVTDEGLQHLERMANLSFLQAHRTKITKEGVSRLEQSLPNVDVYYEHP